MSVQKEIKRLEKSKVSLGFTIPKEEIRAKYQEMLGEYTKTLQLPGFRKGKVPQKVLEQKYAEALKHDALARIVEETLGDTFKDENLSRSERPLPYSMPEMQEEPQLDFDKDLQFSVVYDVLPEVKIGQWKGLNVEHPYAEIEKEDIDRELETIRERNAIVMDRDDGAAAQKGDIVTIDYWSLDENGEMIPHSDRKDFTYTIGSGANAYQFDDDIAGMKKGETKVFDKTFPENYEFPAMAGKTEKMSLTLKELKERKLPDLDDDLAQDVDEKFKTLDDLKNNIKEKMEKNLERRLREIKLDRLLQKIMENTPVTLPESMVRMEVDNRWQRLARYYNTNAETLKQMMGGNEQREEREKEWSAAAEKALHSRLIIETLIEEQNMEVTDAEIDDEIARIAADNNMEADEIRKNYQEERALLYLKEDVKERRIIDILFAENTLKQGKKDNYLDFMSDNS